MTDQPRTPRLTVPPPVDGGYVTLSWTNPNPKPYTSVAFRHRGKCEECGLWSLWSGPGEPLYCGYHTALAAYAALPWWRRAVTRKPRP